MTQDLPLNRVDNALSLLKAMLYVKGFIVRLISTFLFLAYSSISWGASITWAASKSIDANEIKNCMSAAEYIGKGVKA